MEKLRTEVSTRETQNLKRQSGILGLACFLYACFYAVCRYKAGWGINEPFFLAGSLWFYCFCLKKLEISLKKDSFLYMGSILLLGISTFFTADVRIVGMNRAGIGILTISFLLHQFFDDKNWTFGRYAGYVIGSVFGCISEISRPFQDIAEYQRSRGKKEGRYLTYILLGLLIGIPVLFILWLLLMSADKVFLDISRSLWECLDFFNGIGIVVTVVVVFLFSYCLMSLLCRKLYSEEKTERPQTEAILAITVFTPIAFLYLVFCGVQISCLFLRKGNLGAYTYAEYARQGYFQLLAVCVINLVMVLVCHAYVKQNRMLKGILTVISACTYIMIISAAYRMLLYIKHYYLTFLRVFVLWSLVVLFILLTGVIVSIYKESFPLFRYSMVVVTVCYLFLSFGHPDYWIARCNTANTEKTEDTFFYGRGYEDFDYLAGLSADAAPVLLSMEQEQDWVYHYTRKIDREYEQMSLRDFNLSLYVAEKILQNY